MSTAAERVSKRRLGTGDRASAVASVESPNWVISWTCRLAVCYVLRGMRLGQPLGKVDAGKTAREKGRWREAKSKGPQKHPATARDKAPRPRCFPRPPEQLNRKLPLSAMERTRCYSRPQNICRVTLHALETTTRPSAEHFGFHALS